MRAIRNLGLGALLALLAAGCGETSSQERGGELPRGLGKADGSNSCVNICGDQAPAGCWCDEKCEGYGDCCPDKQRACEQKEPSCEGHCGGKSPAGCYCDGVCEQYGDCCADKKDVCEQKPGCTEDSQCAAEEYCAFEAGACISPTMNILEGECAYRPEICAAVVIPVCGCDGQTYTNSCKAASAGVSVASQGPCDVVLPPKCGPFPGGACPADYTCDIDTCALGASGQCVPSTGACTKEFKPVCGCDGVTYGNDCQRVAAGAAKDYEGACKVDPCLAQDAAGEGMCEMFMGYAWTGSACVGVSGCSCVGDDCGELQLNKADCEAAYAGCVDCWGAWLDQNGTCRTPADGVYPDSCCENLQEKQCLAVDASYQEALAKARVCHDGPTFAPQCTMTKFSSLKCGGCPVPINTNLPQIQQAQDIWKSLGCDELLWACPMVMCIAPEGPSCEEGFCQFTFAP